MRFSSRVLPKAALISLFGSILCVSASAQTTATTKPVGFMRLPIKGASDNYVSLPIPRPPVFAGAVGAPVTANTVKLNGATFTPDQFKYVAGTQREHYYLEFANGSKLEGAFYKIVGNTADTLTLDTEGDDLTTHSLGDGPLAVGDAASIIPFWRVRDIFGDTDATVVIEKRPNRFAVRDDIRLPDENSVGLDKAPKTKIFYVTGVGWRKAGDFSVDMADKALPPNTALIVRRRNASDTSLLNFGQVLVHRSASFVEGGNGTRGNDSFVSLNHAAPSKLDDAGLHSADPAKSVIKDSPSPLLIEDSLLAFDNAGGLNRAPSAQYYYLAGAGWRQVGSGSTTVGQDILLQPGTAYIVRKKPANSGVDWLIEPGY